MDAIKIHDLFDLTHTKAICFLDACEYPWEALTGIGDAVLQIGKSLEQDRYNQIAEDIWIAKSAKISPLATITGPCLVVVKGESSYETGRKKFRAMLGDFAEIGCNSVLNPGTVIGRNTQVYPLSSVRGVVPENSIVKAERGIVCKG